MEGQQPFLVKQSLHTSCAIQSRQPYCVSDCRCSQNVTLDLAEAREGDKHVAIVRARSVKTPLLLYLLM